MIDWSTVPGVKEDVLSRLGFCASEITIFAVYLSNDGMQVQAGYSDGSEIQFLLPAVEPISTLKDAAWTTEAWESLVLQMADEAAERNAVTKRMLFILSIFVPSVLRETALGDAEERFHADVERFGVRRATWLLRWDVARTAVVWLWNLAEDPVLRLLGAVAGTVRGR